MCKTLSHLTVIYELWRLCIICYVIEGSTKTEQPDATAGHAHFCGYSEFPTTSQEHLNAPFLITAIHITTKTWHFLKKKTKKKKRTYRSQKLLKAL